MNKTAQQPGPLQADTPMQNKEAERGYLAKLLGILQPGGTSLALQSSQRQPQQKMMRACR